MGRIRNREETFTVPSWLKTMAIVLVVTILLFMLTSGAKGYQFWRAYKRGP